ncbi:MAG TPA: 2-oxoacid:acceptor oxidoreductase subunit alpha [Thermoanaerobaculia bacterium]|nr:2-oxoacid:acceptor oxidoreductase subunit alpha [Thermoanaerobaculia bacterium]
MPSSELTLGIVGSGGDGVITVGDIVSQAAAFEGLNVIKTEAYGPQIRGGESSCNVRIAVKHIEAQADRVDVLVVFNWADYGRFKGEMVPGDDAIILYEASDPTPPPEGIAPKAQRIAVPYVQIATDAAGTKAAKNIVTLGILAGLFNVPVDAMRAAISKKFSGKKAGLLEANVKGFEAGIAFAKTLGTIGDAKRLEYTKGAPKVILSGNEACAIAAVHAGCRFFAGYPITPSSEVLHFLSEWLPRVGGSVVQTEDELSAIGAVVGASFAGVKSMTSTSGPGLSLMTETLGLSAMAEVPAVVWNVQRGGPSTGLPTKSEQSDLFQGVFAGHGDQPRVVLSAEDVETCFHATVDAFNIAEEYQIPVIVLADQAIAQRRETVSPETFKHAVIDRRVPKPEEMAPYQRYKDTADGVSPMSYPGIKGAIYQTNGLEHDENGRPGSMHLLHEKMSAKRYRKLRPIRDKYHDFYRMGPEKADLGILCWGSSKGPVKEAVEAANAAGAKVAAFAPKVLYPFPKAQFLDFQHSVKRILVIEISFAAQFYKYIRTFMDLPEEKVKIFARSGGKNLTVPEVAEQIRKALSQMSHEEVLI